MRPPRSLQGRLLALVLGLVVGVWLATAAMTWVDVRHELDELLDSHLAQAAALLVVQQVRDFEDDGHHVDAPTLHRYAPKVAFQVFHEGRLAMRSANAPDAPMVEFGEKFREGFKTVQIGGLAWRVFAAHGGESDVQVYVGERVSSRDSIVWAALRAMLWPMAVALPLLALAIWWAVRQGVMPLRRLGSTLAERQPQALHPVFVERAPSEMVPMIEALNGLFERTGALMESERRFTADAAHELRTPIAAIRAQAQVAIAESDAADRQHALRATLEGCDRATHLVEQLLTLSRLETGAATAASPVELGALVRQVVAELASQAIRKGQTIEVDGLEACRIAGDATLVAVLVRNLVDNAVRYSAAGATTRVAVLAGGNQARLLVEDSGPGLDAPDMARLGERFFRVMGSGEAGSGLGWSIVRRIAAAQGATIRVNRSAALGGLAIEVEWPALP
jgi:two-component system, OmpR family, sensor histidine kinase QseC